MSIRSLFRKATRRKQRTGSARSKLGFERLEDLCLPSFLTPMPYDALNSSQLAIARGDFTGDGRLDLAVANSTISVLIGNADGTFQTPIDLDAGGAVSLATGDFNSDGKLDLATADRVNVRVLLGNGDGTFQAPGAQTTGGWMSPVSVAVGDFNTDGKLDLGVASSYYVPGSWGYGWYPGYYLSQASVLLGSGTGSFAPTSAVDSYFASDAPDAATFVADVNSDGKQDFVIGGESGQIIVHLGPEPERCPGQ